MPVVATVAMSASATKAFEAMAKTKKKTWKAMERALEQVKSSASSLGVMSSVMGVFSVVTKLALVPLKELIAELVSEEGFIGTLTALGTEIGTLIVESLDPLIGLLKTLGTTFGDDNNELIPFLASLVSLSLTFSEIGNLPIYLLMGTLKGAMELAGVELGTLTEELNKATTAIKKFFKELQKNLLSLGEDWFKGLLISFALIDKFFKDLGGNIGGFVKDLWEAIWKALTRPLEGIFGDPSGGSRAVTPLASLFSFLPWLHEGTKSVPYTGGFILEKGEEVKKKGARRERGEININIDLRNAVVDNVDRLSRRIAEQVLIQIG